MRILISVGLGGVYNFAFLTSSPGDAYALVLWTTPWEARTNT